MAVFSYAVLDPAGKQRKGTLEADNPRHARQVLRDRGLVPLDVTAVNADNRRGKEKTVASRASLPVAEVALFTRQLATLLQSALPIADALMAIAQQSERAQSKALVSSLRSQVLEGRSLATAMGQYPRAFPSMYCATVAAGEHTGRLDLVLSKLADYTESSHKSRQKVQLALIYPSVLLGLAVLVVTGLLTYIVPDVVKVFADQGQALPPLTQAMLDASDFLVNWGGLGAGRDGRRGVRLPRFAPQRGPPGDGRRAHPQTPLGRPHESGRKQRAVRRHPEHAGLERCAAGRRAGHRRRSADQHRPEARGRGGRGAGA